jgi:hypothetical protein
MQDFYTNKPAQAMAESAGKFERVVMQQSAGKLYRDVHTTGKAEDKFAGRAGRRGELVRHPGESGSVYGISTFVDDYAGWATKLDGVTLGETVHSRATRYFDA